VPYSYGFAILFLTLLVKAVTFPLTKKQVEGSIQMQAIQVSVFPIYRIPPTDHSPSLTATSHSTEVLPTSNVLTTGNSYGVPAGVCQIHHKRTVLPLTLVTVQTDYPPCCPYIVQYIAQYSATRD